WKSTTYWPSTRGSKSTSGFRGPLSCCVRAPGHARPEAHHRDHRNLDGGTGLTDQRPVGLDGAAGCSGASAEVTMISMMGFGPRMPRSSHAARKRSTETAG